MRTTNRFVSFLIISVEALLFLLQGCGDDDRGTIDACVDCHDAVGTDSSTSSHQLSDGSDSRSDSGLDSSDVSEPDQTVQRAFCEGEGVWYDSVSDLCWQDPPAESVYTWQEAILHCERLSLADYDDWEMPDIDQLRSLVQPGTGSKKYYDEPHCSVNLIGGTCTITERAPACLEADCGHGCGACTQGEGPGEDDCYWDPELNGSCIDHGFWSSSEIADDPDVWGVDFKDAMLGQAAVNRELFLRCVRSGPDWRMTSDTDANADGGTEVGSDAGSDGSANRDSGPTVVEGECKSGSYQGEIHGNYYALTVGDVKVAGVITFKLIGLGNDMYDIVDGRIESSEGGFTVNATLTGQLNCLTGETEGIVVSGDYQLSTFTGTMSANYDKSELLFWGSWQVVDEAPGYSGSGFWDATWLGSSM